MPRPRRLPRDLTELVATVKQPAHGFFGPDSLLWQMNRERVLFLGGPRALLLQIAHPLVAAGVAQHSRFQEDPIGRSFRTFSTVFKVVFGSVDQALDAALRTRRIHTSVQGRLPHATGMYRAGTPYHANEPDLLLWVHATLLDTAMLSYEWFVRPLRQVEKERYYRESSVFARLFGVPQDRIPPTLSEFREYFDRMVRETLAIGPTAHELASALLWGPPIFRPLAPGNFLLASAMLPPTVREGFGLPWNLPMAMAFRQFRATVRQFWPRLPTRLRELAAYRKAMQRVRVA